MTKRYLIYPLRLVATLALLEFSFWGYFTFAYVTPASPTTRSDLASLVKAIPQTDLERFIAGQFDPYLGWNNGPEVTYEHEVTHYTTSTDRIRVAPHESDGVRWLISEGIADPARVCIMGASFGGYAAMWGAITTPELYSCRRRR